MNFWLRLFLALLLGIALSAAGFLWIEYTVPGIWPPWVGLPEDHSASPVRHRW